ncbi:hypothetical protein, partial [Citrobacter portucalensis]
VKALQISEQGDREALN